MPRVDQIASKLSTTSRKLLSVALESRIRKELSRRPDTASEGCDFMVFFAEPPAQDYQLQQWLRPFEELRSRGHAVTLVLMNALTARSMAGQTTLPILLTRSMEHIEQMIDKKAVRGIFYVNNSQANFTMLRVAGPAHIHLSHGESEKSSMVSNQLKAYDFAFIAGPAALARITGSIPRFDPTHLVQIGRPQLDGSVESIDRKPGTRISVLYAPTWEGDSGNMAYGSVAGIGGEIVDRLLSDARFAVVFRPHPKTGSLSRQAAVSAKAIRGRIAAAAQTDPEAGHSCDDGPDFITAIRRADVVIADVSAMAMDAIGIGSPLLLASSPALERQGAAATPALGIADVVQVLDTPGLALLNETVAGLAATGVPAAQASFRDHVFGPENLGSGTDRFIEAVLSAS